MEKAVPDFRRRYAPHGGDDPGKIGVHGELEKDINLKIAKKLKKELEARGIKVLMTRKGKGGLSDASAENKKVQDLKKRVDLINEIKPKLAVSIHQNSYETADVKGAQVFYYKDSQEGEEMAKKIQKSLTGLSGEHNRPIKANDTYFMLKRTKVPTLIVECGFLSNPEEASMLSDDGYQEKMSKTVADGIMDCLK